MQNETREFIAFGFRNPFLERKLVFPVFRDCLRVTQLRLPIFFKERVVRFAWTVIDGTCRRITMVEFVSLPFGRNLFSFLCLLAYFCVVSDWQNASSLETSITSTGRSIFSQTNCRKWHGVAGLNLCARWWIRTLTIRLRFQGHVLRENKAGKNQRITIYYVNCDTHGEDRYLI